MQDRINRNYAILRLVCFASAAAITYLVWARLRIPDNVWPSVIAFAAFATLAELLTVNLEYSEGGGVTPTGPIFWAAVCVVGPLPAIVVVAICGVLGDSIACASFHAGKMLRSRYPRPDALPGSAVGLRERAIRVAEFLGTVWEPKTGFPVAYAVQMNLQYVTGLVLIVAVAGTVYVALGGRFLVDTADGFGVLHDFVMPFMGMVGAAIVMEHLLHITVMSVIDPIPGVDGLHGFFLRAKLMAVAVSLPVVRAELFLVIVALILAYLYGQIRAWGFVLAGMPVVALRDFFYQWVETRGAYEKTITTLATYMQQYHPYTRGHLKRVADMSERLARELRLPIDSIRHISTAGFLHDIGKVAVSEEILDKPGRPSEEEWQKITEHPVKGAEIVRHIEYFEGIVDWIKFHHKWHDGRGYPSGNGSDGELPIEAAIISVADAFDAMTDDRELAEQWKCDVCGHRAEDGSRPEECPKCGATKNRTYREPKSLDEAIDELRRGAGSQFHPKVVMAFMAMIERDGLHIHAE